MIVSSPGLKSYYPSYGDQESDGSFNGCSPYYCWFVEMGYDRLDIIRWPDGEWAIIELYRSPVVPSMTPWNYVLQGLKNILITPSFIEKYVHQLDLHRKEVWDIAEAKSRKVEEEHAAVERHAEDTAERATKAIMSNPALVERVAREGIKAIDFAEIRKHIPRHQMVHHRPPKF